MNVEVIAVGTELLLGQIVDGNGAHIGRRLAEAGHDHVRRQVVGDNLDRMVEALRLAISRADAVIVTGGLGPTQDDVTREAIAAAAGVELLVDQEYEAALRDRWAARGRTMPETNLRQASYPEGGEMLPNPKGTAPGLRMTIDGTEVFALPGVPAEMHLMLDEQVLPRLRSNGVVASRIVRTFGESESRIAELLGDLFESQTNPTVAFLASDGEIRVRLTAKADDPDAAKDLLVPLEAEVVSLLDKHVFAVESGPDLIPVEEIVLDACRLRGWTLATAESATGGMVAERLTSVPGSSDVVRGSVVAYATDVKRSLLVVPDAVVDGHGVVSAETALAMARGAQQVLGADVAVAITGSAGPTPQEQPVGTMWFAVATPDDVRTRLIRLPGDRERVRTYATTTALHLVRLAVDGTWW